MDILFNKAALFGGLQKHHTKKTTHIMHVTTLYSTFITDVSTILVTQK